MHPSGTINRFCRLRSKTNSSLRPTIIRSKVIASTVLMSTILRSTVIGARMLHRKWRKNKQQLT